MTIGIRAGVNVGGGEGYAERIGQSGADFVVASESELVAAVNSASRGDVIFVRSGETISIRGTLELPSGVGLASNRGQNGFPGGHVRRTDNPQRDDDPAVIVTDARVTGLRLEGPYSNESDPHLGNVVRTRGEMCEVDNCEIWGGGTSGVACDADETAVHHNHIRDNVAAGNGYGVAAGPSTEIYANSFEHNRHAIAGAGDESYEVYDNWFGAAHTHHVVDMHGAVDHPGGVNLHVHHNKCEAESVSFIRVRGVPEERCLVENNWIFNTREPCVTTTGWADCSIHQTNTTTGYTNFAFRQNHLGTTQPPDTGIDISTVALGVLGGGAVLGGIVYARREQLL